MPRRWVVFAFATVLFSVMPAVPATAAGPTHVTSHITTNTTWTRTGEPYIVDIATLWVQPGVTLTIQPGVRVVMNQSLGVLEVKGNLQAIGTKARPIVFTSGQDYFSGGTGAAKGQWWNISFVDAGTGRLDNVVIKYGGFVASSAPWAYTVLNMSSSLDVWVTNSKIHDNNNSGVLAAANVPIHISNSKIFNNDIGVSVVGASNGVAQIDHSTLSNNSQYGLFVNHGGIPLMQSVITSSNIVANGQAVQLQEYAFVPTERYPTGHGNNIWFNNGTRNIDQLSVYTPRTDPTEHLWDDNYWGENILNELFPCPFAPSAWPFHLVDTSDVLGLPNRGPIQSTKYSNPLDTGVKCRADDFAVHNVITDPIRTGAPDPQPP
jgi:hypothetical protein